MLNKKFFAFSLIGLVSVVISALVATHVAHQDVSSAAVVPVQTPGAAVTRTSETRIDTRDFEQVPGMFLLTPSLNRGSLIILFSVEHAPALANLASNVAVRCLVDGGVAEPGAFSLGRESTRDREGAQTNTLVFYAPNVGPGSHQVIIEARRAGVGALFMRTRTLAVINVQ